MPQLNGEYIERMEDVLRLYEKPIDPKEPVVCLDEKPVQLLADVKPVALPKPGRVQRRDYEYRRQGTANIFVAVEPKAGRYLNKVTRTRKALDFAEMLQDISRKYSRADRIHLVVDNLSTHREKSLVARFGKARGTRLWSRFRVHYTPKHASWLNQAEIGISLVSRGALRKRRIETISELSEQIACWTKHANQNRFPICWRFSRKKAREKFQYLPVVRRAEH